jgi:hypothetical protein
VWLDDRPLFVRQFFASCHAKSVARLFMRPLLVIIEAADALERAPHDADRFNELSAAIINMYGDEET